VEARNALVSLMLRSVAGFEIACFTGRWPFADRPREDADDL
jgi:hypothetical protein